MAKFTFKIEGHFETDDATMALLQLSHLAEITRTNINEKLKLEFTNINVNKETEFSSFQAPKGFWPDKQTISNVQSEVEGLYDVEVTPLEWKDKMAGSGMPVD